MRLELKDIKDGCLRHELTCRALDFPVLTELAQQEDVVFIGPIQFDLRLQKTGQLVEVDGLLHARVKMSCGRCLQPYEKTLSGDFALTFTPFNAEKPDPNEEELELDSDELGLVYYRDESLDLLPPLQDQLVMTLPISPLCRDECKGLCSECGCNLNVEKCHCVKQPFNAKFAALAGLKIESSDK